ncbi:MAG: hypothetical protein HY689_10135 [Chloroflexi bacterium]|nr:hypothetical protein [Chloroflexota bacterium]
MGRQTIPYGAWALLGGALLLVALAFAATPARPGSATHAFRTIPAFPPLGLPAFTGDPRLEPLPQGPVEIGEKAGWFNDAPVKLRFFPRPSVGDGGPDDNHADMYIFVFPDGRPVPQPPLLESAPKGALGSAGRVSDFDAQLFSASWEVHVVRVQPDYVPGTITSVCQLEDPALVLEDLQTNLFVNFPVLPPNATVPNLEANGLEIEEAFFEGQIVRFIEYEVHDREHEVSSIYFFRDPAGNFRGNPVVPRIPGMPHYSSFWEVQIVEVPADYVDNSLRSEAAILASGFTIVAAGFQVNCPVIEVAGQRTRFRSEEDILFGEDGRFDKERFPLRLPNEPQPFHTQPTFNPRLFGFDLEFVINEMTSPATVHPIVPPDPLEEAINAVRCRGATPASVGLVSISASPGGIQTLIQDAEGHFVHLDQRDIDAGTFPDTNGDGLRDLQLLGQAIFERQFSRDEGRGPAGFQASCASCHGNPETGGLFVSGGAGPRIRDLLPGSDTPGILLRRNPPHLFGSAVLSQLGVELNRDPSDPSTRLPLTDANPHPHGWKGHVKALRDFNNVAFNGALGMPPTEVTAARLKLSLEEAATRDLDHDTVVNELSVGDITAATVFQALLPRPTRRNPTDPQVRAGQSVFAEIGCARCHTPVQKLESTTFHLGNPLSTATIPIPLGDPVVELFSDLKRHKMGSPLADPAPQAGVAPDVFKTRELWGLAATAPYLHDGSAPTLLDAIRKHGGASRADLKVLVELPVPLGGDRYAVPIQVTNTSDAPVTLVGLHLVALRLPTGGRVETGEGNNGPGAVLHLTVLQVPGSDPPDLRAILAPGATGMLWAFYQRSGGPGDLSQFKFRVFDDAGYSEAAAETETFEILHPQQQEALLAFLNDLVLPLRRDLFLEAWMPAPKEGAQVTGVVEVQASVAAEAGLTGVSFTVDTGGPVLAMIYDMQRGFWVTNWDSTTVANGPHTLRVYLADRQRQQRELTTVVTVAN